MAHLASDRKSLAYGRLIEAFGARAARAKVEEAAAKLEAHRLREELARARTAGETARTAEPQTPATPPIEYEYQRGPGGRIARAVARSGGLKVVVDVVRLGNGKYQLLITPP